jgi:hypothetical protein
LNAIRDSVSNVATIEDEDNKEQEDDDDDVTDFG